jgi:hypothetical protein
MTGGFFDDRPLGEQIEHDIRRTVTESTGPTASERLRRCDRQP